MRVWRKAAAVGAATAITMGSAAFAAPGVASADTVSTDCGGSVSANVGDTVKGNTSVLGLDLGAVTLGTVQQEGTSVLSKQVGVLQKMLCEVTVKVTTTADQVAENVSEAAPGPAKSVTDPVADAVTGVNEQARQAAGAEEREAEKPPSDSNPGSGSPGSQPDDSVDMRPTVPPPGSMPYSGSLPGYTFPFGDQLSSFSLGSGSLFDTAPGLRYGAGFDGYAPQFGLLGEDGSGARPDIRNAGSANAIAPPRDSGIGLPMLLAVLALAGASAGLVRTWVLRTAAGTAD